MDEWAKPGDSYDPWRPPAPPPQAPFPAVYPGPPPPVPGGMTAYPPMGPGTPVPYRGMPPGPVPTPPDVEPLRPVAVREVPGTPFGLMIMGITPTVSGPGVGALVAGIGSILVTMIELCFGLIGASGGWGPAVAGAFAVLAGALAIGAIALGSISLRQIRRARATGGLRGRGQALAGIVCGSIGLAMDLGAIALAAVIAS